jgi:tRNA(Ile)-lysidine synthase
VKNQIQNYINQHALFSTQDTIIVGISGGRDSVSMVHILNEMGYSLILAHCNFKLRGKESDGDEAFVRNLAKQVQLKIEVNTFETEAFAEKQGISIQMAARELRFAWFETLSQKYNTDKIALAHNKNDVVETFFINLIRGTGIEGITGIKAQNGKIVRPLLDTPRADIDVYIQENKLKYREDSTNASNKYLRNKLRNQIIPQFKEINEQFDQTMIENMERFSQVNQVYKNEIQFKKSKTLIPLSDQTKIDIERLKHLSPSKTYLYEFLKPYGFSASTIEDINESLNAESGKMFFSKTHQLIKNRSELIIEEISKTAIESVFLDDTQRQLDKPINLKIELIDIENFKLNPSRNIASIDFDKLKFPLILRKWEHGDFFMPLGMNRMKKVSDFLIDNKVPINEKQRTFVLQSSNDIVWIVGMRIDDRYKFTDKTRKIYQLKKS